MVSTSQISSESTDLLSGHQKSRTPDLPRSSKSTQNSRQIWHIQIKIIITNTSHHQLIINMFIKKIIKSNETNQQISTYHMQVHENIWEKKSRIYKRFQEKAQVATRIILGEGTIGVVVPRNGDNLHPQCMQRRNS